MMTVKDFIEDMNRLIAIHPKWADQQLLLYGNVPVQAYCYGGNDGMTLCSKKDLGIRTYLYRDDVQQFLFTEESEGPNYVDDSNYTLLGVVE